MRSYTQWPTPAGSLSAAESNYSVTELETLAVVWALTRFHSYLYGQSVTVITDHAAVRAVLDTPNPSCKHVRWWTRVHGAGLKDIKIVPQAGRFNSSADTLSRNPYEKASVQGQSQGEVQVASLQSTTAQQPDSETEGDAEIHHLLARPPVQTQNEDFSVEQRKDPELGELINLLEHGELPEDDHRARRITSQKPMFVLENGMLFYIDPKQDHCRRAVVPSISGNSSFQITTRH